MEAISNVKIVLSDRIIQDKILVFDDKVQAIIHEKDIEKYNIDNIIDGEGNYLSAGFVDIHIHGCCGFDTMDVDTDSLAKICESIVKTGVTAFLPTTMTMDFDKIETSLMNIRRHINSSENKNENNIDSNSKRAQILGCHLEGPYISKNKKGAHDERFIQTPDYKRIDSFKDVIKLVTIAPELDNSSTFIKECCQNDIIVSIGHTDADYETTKGAVEAGAKSFTHLFNAMSGFDHRNPGVVVAAMETNTFCELIADNIHVHPAVQRILLNVKGIDNIILVSDAIMACFMQDGEYELGGQKVIVKEGIARLSDGNLAGSTLTLNKALKNFKENTGISLTDVIKAVTINPAKLLGIEKSKGSIDINMDADFAMFNSDFEIIYTYVKGKQVYKKQ